MTFLDACGTLIPKMPSSMLLTLGHDDLLTSALWTVMWTSTRNRGCTADWSVDVLVLCDRGPQSRGQNTLSHHQDTCAAHIWNGAPFLLAMYMQW